jgi:hypothetical protein
MDESTLLIGLILFVVGLFETWIINRPQSTPPEYLDEETRRWLGEK